MTVSPAPSPRTVAATEADALWAAGDAIGAVAAYARALSSDPGDALSAMNLAHALAACGNADGALQWMRYAHAIDPADPVLEMNLGAIHHGRGEIDEASACYARALERRPDYGEAWLNYGNAALYSGDADTAVARFDRALQSGPHLDKALANIVYALSYAANASPAEIRRRAEEWDRRFALPRVAPGLAFADRDPRRPLRIGYVSPDLANHPIGHFMVGVLAHHSRDRFDVTVYSERPVEDDLSARMKKDASAWHKTAGMSDAALIAQIVGDRIDILVDLAGHTSGNRLRVFSAKPAPVQLTWMGSVGTTGLSAMDGLIADRFHVPAGCETGYVERVFRLPNSFLSFTPVEQAPAVGPPPVLRNGYVTFGCFSNPAKINPPLIQAWAEILRRTPGSRLRLQYRWMNSSLNRSRLETGFAAYGIGRDRLSIEGEAGHAQLLAAYNEIDIAFDTSPYSGGATTLEALWMGAPVVTWPQARFASRHAYSFLSVLGLDRLIAYDLAGYIDTACRLAVDLETLQGLRSTLRNLLRRSPLCDTEGFTGDLEGLYREAWTTFR